MKTLQHLLLLMFFCSSVLIGLSQDEDKYKNIRKKDYDQKDQYDDGDYLFPPQPKNNWSIGAKAGAAFVSGDVKPQPGMGFAVDVRKAMGHVFGMRFQVGARQTTGLNYQPANGYRNHAGNPWDAIYYPNNVSTIDGSKVPPYVYYNYRMRYADAALQGIVNLNNINFYKEQNQWNIYAAAGVGVMAYNTKVDAGSGQV
ncbi:MAG: hypothetical protein KDD63_27580, partial [Bacteroidetes bacterium]|nr:hypothetical protein [Bacteroidota bacterium]